MAAADAHGDAWTREGTTAAAGHGRPLRRPPTWKVACGHVGAAGGQVEGIPHVMPARTGVRAIETHSLITMASVCASTSRVCSSLHASTSYVPTVPRRAAQQAREKRSRSQKNMMQLCGLHSSGRSRQKASRECRCMDSHAQDRGHGSGPWLLHSAGIYCSAATDLLELTEENVEKVLDEVISPDRASFVPLLEHGCAGYQSMRL